MEQMCVRSTFNTKTIIKKEKEKKEKNYFLVDIVDIFS